MIEIFFVVIILVILIRKFQDNLQRDVEYPVAWQQQHMYDFPFETGDLILCQFTPLFLGAFCNSYFHHVGVVYQDSNTQQLMIWHMCAPLNILLGHGFFRYGIVLEPLYRVLAESQRCAVRRLHQNIPRYLNRDWMQYQMKSVNFRSSSYIQVLARRFCQPWYDCCFKEYSCADLVAHTYKKMNVLQSFHENLLPEDFVDATALMTFKSGCFLEPCIPLNTIRWRE